MILLQYDLVFKLRRLAEMDLIDMFVSKLHPIVHLEISHYRSVSARCPLLLLQSMMKQAKVVVIGSIGVGKSSITIRFVNNQFNDFLDSTLGAVFFQKIHNYAGKSIKFQFWDTAGQQKYKAIARIYYKDSKVAVVVYDVNSRESFNAMKTWITQLRENGPKNLILAIVGNKIDLIKDKQEVPYKQATDYAKELGAIFKYTSAKQNKGITELFTTVAQKLQTLEDEPTEKQDNNKVLNNKKKNQNKPTGTCCK